ncbi:TPA: DUF3297 family protein [Bacillus cytotoxicus]|nr:DUF3297 family protein [Bacillus cytotoxicus]QTR69150.1 DUF3297 family protein [Bacillus cytotoxicus]QTR72957.1 DUF3297 family protein [Bacillus cytotoxicus]QTR76943.1 DUF3297 family protein [Bacillus cytotoxicus]QTR80998.1 DUF3297 family protein [Bacillus cytotoxicus]
MSFRRNGNISWEGRNKRNLKEYCCNEQWIYSKRKT